MGQKVHPFGFRLAVIHDWRARWYASRREYTQHLSEDLKIRNIIEGRARDGGIAFVETEREGNEIVVTIHSARPGIIIGRGGQRSEELKNQISESVGKRVRLTIMEVEEPWLQAILVARSIAEQLERRVSVRRAMKQISFRVMQSGALGVKISISGRLGGAEIARRNSMHQGRLPLHTLRANIDYGFAEAHTMMGQIGVKVWVYKGDIIPEIEKEHAAAEKSEVSQNA